MASLCNGNRPFFHKYAKKISARVGISGVARPGQARALPEHQVTLPDHQLPRVIS